jgi:solute carrier family 25 folate transporter 32
VSHVAIQFPLYERLKTMLSNEGHASKSGVLVASALSKTIASIATYPHEVIRTRLQNQRGQVKYHNMRHGVVTILGEEGWRAFYRGMGTNLVRTVPASALTLLTFEVLYGWLQ